jgi:hypothetical protein
LSPVVSTTLVFPKIRRRSAMGDPESPPKTDQPVRFGSVTLGEICGQDRRPWGFAELRLNAIERLIQHRFNGPCDTDDGAVLFQYALPMLVEIAKPHGLPVNSQAWAEKWVPVFAGKQEAKYFIWRERKAREKPYKTSATTIGKALNVKWAEVLELKLKTIIAVDRPPEDERRQRKRRLDRERQRKNRALRGCKPRDQSLTALEPWKAEGISKSTFYRRKRKAESND